MSRRKPNPKPRDDDPLRKLPPPVKPKEDLDPFKELMKELEKQRAQPSALDKAIEEKLEKFQAHPIDVKSLDERRRRAAKAAKTGESQMKPGSFDDAIRHFDVAIENDPKKEYYYQRGVCHFSEQEWEKAIEDFSIVLRKDPNHIRALTLRGYNLNAVGRNQEAQKDFNKAQNLISKEIEKQAKVRGGKSKIRQSFLRVSRAGMFFLLGRFADTIADLEQAQKLDPTKKKEPSVINNIRSACVRQARELSDQGKFREAIPYLTKAFNLNTGFLGIRLERGKAYFDNKQYDKALEDMEAILKVGPRTLDAQLLKARCLEKQKKLDTAISEMNKVFGDRNVLFGSVDIAAMLAHLYEVRGNKEKKDQDSAANLYRAAAKVFESVNRLEEAKTAADSLIRLRPDHPDYQNLRARIYRTNGENMKAKQGYDAALKAFDVAKEKSLEDVKVFLKNKPQFQTEVYMSRAFVNRALLKSFCAS